MKMMTRWLVVLAVCGLTSALHFRPALASSADPNPPTGPLPNTASQVAAPPTTAPAPGSTPAKSAPNTIKKDDGNAAVAAAATPPEEQTSDAKGISADQLRKLLAQGYRPKRRGDTVMYCRKEAALNTRFATELCRSAESILTDDHYNSKKALLQMDRAEDAALHK